MGGCVCKCSCVQGSPRQSEEKGGTENSVEARYLQFQDGNGNGNGTAPESLSHNAAATTPDADADVVDSGPPFFEDIYGEQPATVTVTVPGAGFELRYCHASLRGYYPEELYKPNQDSLCAQTCFAGDADTHFFGVFDGHGEQGTHCSQFASRRLLENLAADPEALAADTVHTYSNAFDATNKQLHLSDIDDSMSGTTAITVLVRRDMLFVANVGDSRAIIATAAEDGRVSAEELSLDQTPFRADECERVRRCGARVLTLEQIEGQRDPSVQCWSSEEGNADDDGDPPRVWLPYTNSPGTAFTRSLGDRIAESVGVCADPEVLVWQLTSRNPFFVIASDGVFEFLDNQRVVDIVAAHDDPREACKAVIAESYKLWLQNETRTDDITIIIVQIRGFQNSGERRNRKMMDTKHTLISFNPDQVEHFATESAVHNELAGVSSKTLHPQIQQKLPSFSVM